MNRLSVRVDGKSPQWLERNEGAAERRPPLLLFGKPPAEGSDRLDKPLEDVDRNVALRILTNIVGEEPHAF